MVLHVIKVALATISEHFLILWCFFWGGGRGGGRGAGEGELFSGKDLFYIGDPKFSRRAPPL